MRGWGRRIAGGAVCAVMGLLGAGATVQAAGALQVVSTPALYPAFSDAVHDYVSVCNDQPLSLQVSVPTGTTVVVDAQAPQSGTTFSTQVALLTGQEFLISWSGSSEPYHVRCLPSDFPSWTAQRTGSTQTQFFAVTPTISVTFTGTEPPYVAIFDSDGVPRWWYRDTQGAGGVPLDAAVLPNGDLTWIDASGTTATTPFQEHTLSDPATVVKTYAPFPATASTDPHELQVLPNGDYFLAIATETAEDVSPCGGSGVMMVQDPVLEELSSAGTLLWSWDTALHIPLTQVPAAFDNVCLTGDPYHFNGLQPDVDGNVIVSFRDLGAVYKIVVAPGTVDDGAILWKLGGTGTAESLAISGDPDAATDFGGQHDPRLAGDGTLTLHDNGSAENRDARAVRFRIDTAAKTATLVETVGSTLASRCCGSARKLPGGDWLIAWGSTPDIVETTPSGGTVVFSLSFNRLFSYRAFPITDASYGAELTAGMNAQYPRQAQGGGPPSNVPEVPAGWLIPGAGLLAGAARIVCGRRGRQRRRPGSAGRFAASPGGEAA